MKKYLLTYLMGSRGNAHSFVRLTAGILILAVISVANVNAQGIAGKGTIDGYWELTAEFPDYDLSAVVRFRTTADGHSVECVVLGPTSGRAHSFLGNMSSNHLSLKVPGPVGEMDAELIQSGGNLSGSWVSSGSRGTLRGVRLNSRKPEPDYYPKYLRAVSQIIRDNFYDPRFNGVDVEKLTAKYTAQLPGVKDDGDFVELMRRLLSEFKTSHTDFYLAPDKLPVKKKTAPITSRRLSPQTYYLGIRHFDPASAQNEQDFWNAIGKALEEAAGFPSLVIDLRGNRGGNLSLVFRALGYFLKPGQDLIYAFARAGSGKVASFSNSSRIDTAGLPVIGTSSSSIIAEIVHDGAAVIRVDTEQKNRYQGRVVLLVDERCFSGCELFSSVLQEKGRATVIGSRTPGEVLGAFTDTIIKNMVVIKKDTGWRLEIPIIDFRTIDGRRLEGNGVKPDIDVAKQRESDFVLAEALRYLEGPRISTRQHERD